MSQPISSALDPEGAHLAALRRLESFRDKRVLEVGCGEGRLTLGIAADARHVLAFDPDAESVQAARKLLPTIYGPRIELEVASAKEIEIAPHSFDLVVFSWSL